LVVVPAGSFIMGDLAPPASPQPWRGERRYDRAWELPAHTVTIARPFAIGRHEVTRREFAAYVAATGREPEPGCLGRDKTGTPGFVADHSWRDPGFEQNDNHPVVCVNRADAENYMNWLTQRTGHRYRFPSEAEWEYAARAGTRTEFPWADDLGAGHANCKACGTPWNDRSTSPVGSFAPNGFGLFDMPGNVWEPTLDCFHVGYAGAPVDGAAWDEPNCAVRVLRGGSWYDIGDLMRSALRGRGNPANRIGDLGFRVVRDINR
jgi:formylglycine-generating enzyme required for sulfatase activity